MELIYHRRNTLEDLKSTNTDLGVEVDIRTNGDEIIIHHDPMTEGPSFNEWIKFYKHGTLILNIKEEGLESYIIKILEKEKISNYFFLDQSFPFLIKYAKKGERRCAVRVSEYESLDTALSLSGRVDWIWLDCFTKLPIGTLEYKALKNAGFKICLVSPELQGRKAEIEIEKMNCKIIEYQMNIDAVCTKRPDLWQKLVLSR